MSLCVSAWNGFIPIPHSAWHHQSSVLSPVLFLLVVDPILLELQSKSCGLNINGLFLGVLSHADDIQTLSTKLQTPDRVCEFLCHDATTMGLVLSTENFLQYLRIGLPLRPTALKYLSLTLQDASEHGGFYLFLQYKVDRGQHQESSRSLFLKR